METILRCIIWSTAVAASSIVLPFGDVSIWRVLGWSVLLAFLLVIGDHIIEFILKGSEDGR